MHTLVHFRLCPFSRSIRIALAELGIEAALVEERPWEGRPEFLALNAAGEVPVLSIDNGPTLCGAYSISEYLFDVHGGAQSQTGRPALQLFPGSAVERAEVRRLTDWFHRKLDREVTRELLHEKVYARLTQPGGGHAPDADILRAIRTNLRYHLRYLSHVIDRNRWLAGDAFSFADMAAAAHVSVIDYLGEIAWEDHPRAKTWYARVKSRPSLRPILADRVPGFPPAEHYANLDF